jgi:cell division septation protein DedD
LPKNEEGEFELILGNRQLLSVFFIVVILLGVFFTMGYIVGRNSAPLVADATPASGTVPLVVDSPVPAAGTAPADIPAAAPATASSQTAAQQPDTAPEKEPAPAPSTKAEVPKPEPVKPARGEAPKKIAAVNSQPAAGSTYLQLAATSKHEADVMVDVLRQKGFKAMAAEITEKAGTYRVLVGPVTDSTVNSTRAELQKTGFPGNAAIRRTF